MQIKHFLQHHAQCITNLSRFSGVDVLGLLESLGVSETLMAPLKESSAGYFALAFALYKLVTPLRYAVTVGNVSYYYVY